MPWIVITAILGILFISTGRRKKGEKGIERLGRFHTAEGDETHGPEKRGDGRFRNFFIRVYRSMPESVRESSKRDLEEYCAFLDYPVETLAGIRVCTTVCLPVSILLMTSFSPAGISLSIPCVFLGTLFPKIIASKERGKFLSEVNRLLPRTADMLYSLILGGKNLDQAFRGAADSSQEPLKGVLMIAVREMELGSPRDESFDRLARRYPLPQLSSLLRSITEAERRGLELSDTLEVYAHELRLQNRDDLRMRVAKAPLKILIPLVFLVLPAAVLLAIGPTLLLTFSGFVK